MKFRPTTNRPYTCLLLALLGAITTGCAVGPKLLNGPRLIRPPPFVMTPRPLTIHLPI
jgi:hypothetical protein